MFAQAAFIADPIDSAAPDIGWNRTGVVAAGEIVDGLIQVPSRIAAKYFYDARGSELFEQITRLPEYYPTRTERAIMLQHGAEIARRIGAGRTLIELGAGNCEKARALCELIEPACFVAVDISAEFLEQAADRLRASLPALDIRAVAADLSAEIVMPQDVPKRQRLVFYPGASIGNFDPPQALQLLTRIRALLEDDGALLIGVDLLKDIDIVEAAYNDAAVVTAAFNRNALNHVNRLIGSDFDSREWRHRAFFNSAASRIEMHLEASRDILVRWPGGQRRFIEGERIHTESSYKYQVDNFVELLARAGFSRTEIWSDERRWFALILARP